MWALFVYYYLDYNLCQVYRESLGLKIVAVAATLACPNNWQLLINLFYTLHQLCFTYWSEISMNHRITESQNHRMVGVGKALCGSSSPTPLPKQGHLQQAAQDLVQARLKYLQRRRIHNLPGQPVPVLRHPQREEVLPHVQMELPVLPFVPIVPCPVGHHWKELGPILLTPTLQIFISIY